MQPHADTARDIEMVSALVEGAFALALKAGEFAKAAGNAKAFCEVSAEYRHCSFAVRMGIRLKMKLASGVKPRAVAAVLPAPEPVEHEISERERSEHDPVERDKEYEGEPVSLPAFLKSLGVVVRNAERHGDRLPAHAVPALTRLRGLLAEANAARAAAVEPPMAAARSSGIDVLERPPSAPTSRSRLLGSAAAPPRGPPRRSSA